MSTLCVQTGKGLSDNEMMAWRQLHLTAQQHKQILTIPTTASTPQITSPIDNGSGLLSLQDVMLKHQQRFEKRRLSENDLDRDIKLPKLSPIENNTCTSAALPLSLTGISLISEMRSHAEFMAHSNEKLFVNHREKAQNFQYLERLRRMNERSHCKERGSRVNFDQHNSAKTVREELANRKQKAKNGKFELVSFFFCAERVFHLGDANNNFPPSFISSAIHPKWIEVQSTSHNLNCLNICECGDNYYHSIHALKLFRSSDF